MIDNKGCRGGVRRGHSFISEHRINREACEGDGAIPSGSIRVFDFLVNSVCFRLINLCVQKLLLMEH